MLTFIYLMIKKSRCQQRVLKTFPGPDYPCSMDGVVRLWHLLVFVYTAHHFILQQLNPHDSKDGSLSTLCHSCGFDYQQSVLKTFPGTGYPCSEDGVVLTCMLCIYLFLKSANLS